MEGFQVHLGGSLDGGDGEGSGFGRKIRGLKTTADQLPDYVERVLRRFDAGPDAGRDVRRLGRQGEEEDLA